MNEEKLWTSELPDGRTFRCVWSDLHKKKFRNPETGRKVDSETGKDVI